MPLHKDALRLVLVLVAVLLYDSYSFSLLERKTHRPTNTWFSSTSRQQHGWRSTTVAPRKQHSTALLSSSSSTDTTIVTIDKLVGSGSYGTVHLCSFDSSKDKLICKRAWTTTDDILQQQENPQERADRCRYYFDVEKHCFEKAQQTNSQSNTSNMPNYRGTFKDQDDQEWMVFDLLTRDHNNDSPALTLEQVMQLDWSNQHLQEQHHLYTLQQELGIEIDDEGDDNDAFGVTLDTVLSSLLDALDYIHSLSIVHRDVKPSNLLCTKNGLVLFDFGSAADMEPQSKNLFGFQNFVGIESENRVALSPIYAAPETYIKPKCEPLNFDVYSAGLVFCQLLFNYLDERTDAGFHQQVIDANFDLDTWLSRELSSKVRPGGLDDALLYLGDRQGLWNLLRQMLRCDPEKRIASGKAKRLLKDILDGNSKQGDGSFFESVVNAMEMCDVPELFVDATTTTRPTSRPLHFVATFERKLSLGLILSEANADNDEENDEMDPQDLEKWKATTKDAIPGQVFVKEIVSYGQADQMGIFEIGDRLQGVGELPLAQGGFEKVVEMLDRQPPVAKTVKVHFDRQSSSSSSSEGTCENAAPHLVRVVQQGAWSSKGRRKTQEDTFVLHQVHNPNQDILVAGVFDGHAGTAAAQTASQLLPTLVVESGTEALDKAWTKTCQTYREGCDKETEICLAEYDSREGVLNANTGSDTVLAGTTAAVVSIASHDAVETMSVLNCGDSRTLIIGKPAENRKKKLCCFATVDHSPSNEREAQRLQEGRKNGLDYALPQCSLSKWWLSVGDYQYAVSRSLEGSFATSKGIVSDADVHKVSLVKLLADRECACVVVATDGLFEVLDNELVGKELISKRENGMSADDAAKALCSLAIEKGTTDNVSVLVIYLE